jgi:hypothetical protein
MEEYSYVGHDIIGAKMAKQILERMKYPKKYIDPIVSVVRHHMDIHNIPKMRDIAKIRKLIGHKHFNYIYEVAICDTLGTLNESSPEPDCSTLIKSVSEYQEQFPEILPSPIVTGNDLIASGLKPTDSFKKALDKAYDQQLRKIINKQKLLNFAIGIYNFWEKENEKNNSVQV